MSPQELINKLKTVKGLWATEAIQTVTDLMERAGEVYVIEVDSGEPYTPPPKPKIVYPERDVRDRTILPVSKLGEFKIGDTVYYKDPIHGHEAGKIKWFLTDFWQNGICYECGGWDTLNDLTLDPDYQLNNGDDLYNDLDDSETLDDW